MKANCMIRFVVWLCLGGLLSSAWAAPLQVKTFSQEGYLAKYAPNNPERPGICIEIMRAIEKLDPGISFVGLNELATTARIEQGLQHGDIDVFFGHLKTRERQSKFLFAGPPLYVVAEVLVVRKDDPVRVRDWSDVQRLGQDGVVLVVKGAGQVEYLRSVGGLRIDDNSRLISTNLRKLQAGRGRFYFGSENTVSQAIKSMRLESEVKILPLRFQREGLFASFSRKTDPALVKRVVDALNKLESNGELKRIRSRYQIW